jgi:hypothetical protein
MFGSCVNRLLIFAREKWPIPYFGIVADFVRQIPTGESSDHTPNHWDGHIRYEWWKL